jgi:hypothetical protein
LLEVSIISPLKGQRNRGSDYGLPIATEKETGIRRLFAEPHVKDTECCFRDGFQDGILAVLRDGQRAARGVPKRLVLETG